MKISEIIVESTFEYHENERLLDILADDYMTTVYQLINLIDEASDGLNKSVTDSLSDPDAEAYLYVLLSMRPYIAQRVQKTDSSRRILELVNQVLGWFGSYLLESRTRNLRRKS